MLGVRTLVHRVALAGMLLAMAGCTSAPPKAVDPAPRTPAEGLPAKAPETERPTPIPESTEGFYSWDSRTGVAKIDDVISAIATNVSDLTERLQMVEQPCPVNGVNGPIPCEAGKAPGSSVPVFRYFWCDGTYLTPTDAAGTLRRYVTAGPNLYAAYQLTGNGPAGLGAKYGIMMANGLADPNAFLLYLDADGRIVSMKTGCGMPGALAPVASTVTYLLPPLAGQEAKAEQTAYFTGLLQGEGAQALAILEFATGETDCFGLDCSKPDLLGIAEALKRRCDKIGPTSIREAGGYDPALHEELLDAFVASCAQAAKVTGTTPPPEEQAILEALEATKMHLKAALGRLK